MSNYRCIKCGEEHPPLKMCELGELLKTQEEQLRQIDKRNFGTKISIERG